MSTYETAEEKTGKNYKQLQRKNHKIVLIIGQTWMTVRRENDKKILHTLDLYNSVVFTTILNLLCCKSNYFIVISTKV